MTIYTGLGSGWGGLVGGGGLDSPARLLRGSGTVPGFIPGWFGGVVGWWMPRLGWDDC